MRSSADVLYSYCSDVILYIWGQLAGPACRIETRRCVHEEDRVTSQLDVDEKSLGTFPYE
jgi:hypothetical protein